VLRTPAEIESLFDGLEWVPPGFVSIPLWRPELCRPGHGELRRIGRDPEPIDAFGGVARKPETIEVSHRMRVRYVTGCPSGAKHR
jgi:hypothetical protein